MLLLGSRLTTIRLIRITCSLPHQRHTEGCFNVIFVAQEHVKNRLALLVGILPEVDVQLDIRIVLASDVVESKTALACSCPDPIVCTSRYFRVKRCLVLGAREQSLPEPLTNDVPFSKLLLGLANLFTLFARTDDNGEQGCRWRALNLNGFDLDKLKAAR